MVGKVIGQYCIKAEIGRGGMGMVYLAEHQLLGSMVAIKLLLPNYCREPAMVTRFFNEARAAAAVKHPGTVDVYDYGTRPDGSAYIVMEYLEGETLSALLRRQRVLSVPLAVTVARQTAAALAAVHARGVIHRDLKPDNIFLVPDAESRSGVRVKLLDFGIAKLTGLDLDAGTGGPSQTRTGMLLGTPMYMAPEQCRGAGRVDARADLYSLGCILFRMLCGQAPFSGDGSGDILAAHILLPPPPPRSLAPALPPTLEGLILALLEKQPERRPARAEDVVQALRAFESGPVVLTPPPAFARAPAPPAPAATTPTPMSGRHPTTLGVASAAQGTLDPRPRRRLGPAALVLVAGALVTAGVVVAIVVGDPAAPPSAAISDTETTDDDPPAGLSGADDDPAELVLTSADDDSAGPGADVAAIPIDAGAAPAPVPLSATVAVDASVPPDAARPDAASTSAPRSEAPEAAPSHRRASDVDRSSQRRRRARPTSSRTPSEQPPRSPRRGADEDAPSASPADDRDRSHNPFN
ncbi:protein kinase domain-containing protein [Haliangium sp.]|uniref:serine/threonine-protein kinase n=1 Tax=Haliangium sp. TaxID=2663208 RepID=UPI003D0B1DD7